MLPHRPACGAQSSRCRRAEAIATKAWAGAESGAETVTVGAEVAATVTGGATATADLTVP